jgi:hypothetical protein
LIIASLPFHKKRHIVCGSHPAKKSCDVYCTAV